MSVAEQAPGVVLKSRFTTSDSQSFQNYVDYVDREVATMKQDGANKMFSLYQDYMSDPDKTSSLFTKESDHLSKADKGKMKSLFEQAQSNGSVMWQDVISFNNDWLAEKGIYNPKTGSLNEQKLKDVARKSMHNMQEKEGLSGSAVWSGAIHYNTDNIHIHLAMVEPHPTRERGKRKPLTLDKMKSTVVNEISNRQPHQERINDMIRKHMVHGKQKNSTLKFRNRDLKDGFLQVMKQLPADKRQWQYGYSTLNPVRKQLDQLTTDYLKKYHGQDLESLHKMLDKEVLEIKKAYGAGPKDSFRFDRYKQTKLGDLYKRMGNGFLKEMKEFAKDQEHMKKLAYRSDKWQTAYENSRTYQSLRQASYHMGRDYEDWKEQRAYDQLQREIEQSKERD
ncbi:MobP2 family relaxase [Alkalihalobacillus sp. FSL R5-0424]